MASFKVIGILFCVVIATCALPTNEEARNSRNVIQTENDLLDNIYTDCLQKDSLTCLKYKLFSLVDKMLGDKDTITVTEGVQIFKTGDAEGAPRLLNGDNSIESVIWSRLSSFLSTHSIKVDLKGSEIVNAVTSTARSLNDVVDTFSENENAIETEEGRGKQKKAQKLLGPIMAAMALKAAVVAKIALATIALIAGKALIIGKIALVLSAIIGLKKLLGSGGGKHVTYEVVSHPQHSSSHVASHETVYDHGGGGGGGGHSAGFSGGDVGGYASGSSSGHGGWGRSLDAQQLAYRGHLDGSNQQ